LSCVALKVACDQTQNYMTKTRGGGRTAHRS